MFSCFDYGLDETTGDSERGGREAEIGERRARRVGLQGREERSVGDERVQPEWSILSPRDLGRERGKEGQLDRSHSLRLAATQGQEKEKAGLVSLNPHFGSVEKECAFIL